MSSIPPPENAAASEPRPIPYSHRKRDKKQLSCGFCRQRKLRCDRRQPCAACAVRGLGSSCLYPSDSRSPMAPAPPRAQLQPNVGSIEDRLKRIEDIVLANMKTAPVQKDENTGIPQQPSNPPSPAPPVSSAEPADRLTFQYFNEVSILPARVIHPPQFLKEYEDFWSHPSAVSLSWLGLLYGVLSLSHFFSSEPDHRESQRQPKYLECLVQCLIAADYVRGGPYILECLIHYYLVEFYLNPVTEVGNWMVAGMMAQLAFRMGYHRDPSHFPRISAFEGEMRRRVWATIHILDGTMAMLIGAPRIISDGTWNTRPPRNIYDADLDQDCVQLPESRAGTEVTEVSFLLARYKMSLAMGRLVDLSLMNKLESPENVNSAEARLKEAYDSIPEKFKFTSLVHCLSDKPTRKHNQAAP
ncbi:Trichosetin biosynthesis cluster transcription factor TF23 [Colletotrichum fructicola]|nr:Trichosetin biosynthesis cluster transcription factor TF23 [Colletotrichum fructicola]